MEVYNYLNSLKFRTSWEQRCMWRTFVWDIGGITQKEKDEVERLILRSHARDSADLAHTYTYTWYKKGAWEQATLDKQVYDMLYLLYHHSNLIA